jgi:hypothetical protein
MAGELLGSDIDPRLFIQDYSGFVNAANTQSAGLANSISTIAEVSRRKPLPRP